MTVRAVVVSWNGAHLLRPCLRSLLAQTVDDLEVLVVDNGSTDGTVAMLAAEFPTVRVLVSATNVGFAGGVALGCEGFDGEAVLLLNNDAVLAPDGCAVMLDVLRTQARVGAVTAKVLLDGWFLPPGGTDVPERCPAGTPGAVRLVNSTGNLVDRWGAGHDRDWLVPDGQESRDPDVPGLCGAAALLRTTALQEIGGFDPWLFLYYEDTDVSYRLRRAGWSVRYESRAVAEHRHAASSDDRSALFRYYNSRNSLVVAQRHAPAAVAVAGASRQLLGAVLAAVARREPPDVVRARWRGLRDAARRLPRTLGERRHVRRSHGRLPARPAA